MNIPDEAVEALARILAYEALLDADMGGWGFDAETDSSGRFMPTARHKARRYLEAAAPHMLAEAWEEGAREQARCYGMDKDTGPNPYRSNQ